jgi:hypothetical protein
MGIESYQAPLDHFSEYAMSIETDDYPKTDFTQMQFRGPIDYAAMSEAYDEAIAGLPVFNCRLIETHKGFYYDPHWIYYAGIKNRLIFEDCRHMAGDPFDPMEFSTTFYTERTKRRVDVFHEFPLRCYLIRVKDDVHILSILYHHSVMDPSKAYKLVTNTLAGYHERVKGEKPEWASSLGMAMLERKEGYVQPLSMAAFAKEQLVDVWVKNTPKTIAQIATKRILTPGECMGRHSLRAVIEDDKLLSGLLARSIRNHATVNDLLFACARKAILQWNEDRDVPSRRYRFMLITSLIGRVPVAEDAGPPLSGLNFVSDDDAGADIDTITQFFRDTRKDQLKRGVDVQFHNTLKKIVQSFRILPLRIRRNFVRPFMERIPCTFYLSNLGTVWPKIVDGRQTMDSIIKGAGDFVIEDMHSSASISRNLSLGMTVRSHNKRLYLNYVCDCFRFEKDEAKELTGRVTAEIINAAG